MDASLFAQLVIAFGPTGTSVGAGVSRAERPQMAKFHNILRVSTSRVLEAVDVGSAMEHQLYQMFAFKLVF